MTKKNSNNGKTNNANNRGKRRADLSRRKSYGINRNYKPQKNSAHHRELSNKPPGITGFSPKNAQQPRAKNIAQNAQSDGNRENYKAEAVEIQIDTAEKTVFSRWHNNPRITGAVAAVLLFATLAIAIIPSSLSVRAEEQAETAALDPTMQLAKEYIYAGSRMLAIEDYGLSAAPATPSPTPSLTPTPTPPTPTPTPDTPTPTPTPEPPTPTPTPSTPTPETYSLSITPYNITTRVSWTASVSRPSNTDVIKIFTDDGNHTEVYSTTTGGGTSGSFNVYNSELGGGDYQAIYFKDGSTQVASAYFGVIE